MTKHLFFLVIFLTLVAACSSKPMKESGNNNFQTDLSELYQNGHFSIRYPASYHANANFSGKTATMDELIAMDADEIKELPMNEVSINPNHDNDYWISPEVYIVLSRHKMDLPLRMFMGFSIETSNIPNDESMEYIGHSDVDSISFDGYPALEADFFYRAENGDTLIQNQKIVMKPDFSLYYVNIKYNSRTSPETGEKIVSTFQFKD